MRKSFARIRFALNFDTDFCTDFLHGVFARIFCTDFQHRSVARFFADFLHGFLRGILAIICCTHVCTNVWGCAKPLAGKRQNFAEKIPRKIHPALGAFWGGVWEAGG